MKLQSFYEECRACVRVGVDVSEWFSVTVGLREFLTCPWLFSVQMDGVVREVNASSWERLELLWTYGCRF